MNRPLWKWLLAISLSLNAGMLGAVIFTKLTTPSTAPVTSTQHVSLPDHLQLNAEQRARWSQIEQVFLQDLSANWREIRVNREALVQLIFSAKPDRALIDNLQTRIASLQDTQQRRVIAQLLAERDLLDDRQRTLLMDLLLARYKQEATNEERLHRD